MKCKGCAYARDRFGDSCFCVLYGIIIGYGKGACKGFDEIREPEDGSGRGDIRQQEGSEKIRRVEAVGKSRGGS